MRRIAVSLTFADNGGLTIFGPLANPTTKAPSSRYERMYLCPTLDPTDVGNTLMAMLADLKLTEASKPSPLDVEVDEIQF